MLHAVIMAGGSGSRFWPVSRVANPKQLLALLGEQSMIQETVARLGDLVPPARILIVTNERLVESIRDQLPAVPSNAIVGEPCKRDTAPCVGLAALVLGRTDPDATMIVMPADHVIEPASAFRAAVAKAVTMVEQHPSRVVTFGIRPTYPAETFGYIECGEAIEPNASPTAGDPVAAFVARRFREKPKRTVAQRYLDAGTFFWNSGIFVWKAATILSALETFEPRMYERLGVIEQALGTGEFAEVLRREFAAITGRSIDYAVMEHYEDIAVIEAPFQWDDVGSWRSLARLRGTDENSNTTVGKCLEIGTRGSIIFTDSEHLVATLGLEDVIVVHTPDVTLVARKEDEESVRAMVELLKDRGWEEYL